MSDLSEYVRSMSEVDGDTFDQSADETDRLEARIKELEDGSCRYNCVKRKEMCQSFAYHVCKHRKSLMTPTAKVLKDMYADWNKDQ